MPEGPDAAAGPAGGGGQDDVSSAPPPQPVSVRPNGVCVTPSVFQDNIDDYVAYAFIVHHCLCREAAEDYLLQRRTSGTCRTPHQLSAMIEASVDLQTKEVDCCRNGCVAFTASREALTQCDVCKTSRYCSDGRAAKKATY